MKPVKALSVILILAALFGLIGGGMTLKDVVDCKTYWEAKGEESDANLTKLEEGLTTLQENEGAYLEGRETYAQGLKDYEAGKKDLEAGQKEYDAGLKTLTEKQAEYDQGLATLQAAQQKLAAGQKEYDEGQATLTQAATLIGGVDSVSTGFTSWHGGFQAAATNGFVIDGNVNYTAIEATIAQTTTAKKGAEDQLSNLKNNYTAAYKQQKPDATDEEILNALQNDTSQIPGKESSWAETYNSLTTGIAEAGAGIESLTALQGLADGRKTIAAGVSAIVSGIQSNAELSEKLNAAVPPAQQQAMMAAIENGSDAEFDSAVSQFTNVASAMVDGADGLRAQYNAGSAKLAEAKKTLDAGYAEYAAGKAKLDAGAVQLAEGKETLKQAEQTIAEGNKALADAEKQLDDGKAKLDEFEAGRDQIIDGLETLKATETYAGLVSISDRLGADYTYLKDGGDLDIEQGFTALNTAREFSAENSAVVTKELTTRAVAAVLAIVGALLAAVTAVLGFAGKAKTSGVLAIPAALVSAAAVVVAIMAGSELSKVAGSNLAFLAFAAGAVLAIASAVHSVVAFGASKAKTAE